jgi:hypothetical protein
MVKQKRLPLEISVKELQAALRQNWAVLETP